MLRNRLLDSLPDKYCRILQDELEPVSLNYRRPLYQANRPIEHVYFLQTGVASLVNTMKNGAASEVGTIGSEGFVGLPILYNDKQAPTAVYIQVPGEGFRIEAEVFRKILGETPEILSPMLHYAHAFFNQVAQSAACAHHHFLEQRCCRWLLMTRERMGSDVFLLTQEFLAMMLGVRRAGVTVVAGALQKSGLIEYRRGTIKVLDVERLKKRSCECYEVTKREFDRLLGLPGG